MNPDESSSAEPRPQARRFGVLNPETFAPFGYRDFRMLWLMVFVRSAALWLETVARPVLIVQLTGSAFLLGAVLAAYMAPTLILAPIAGIIIDRFPHRRVLVGALLANITSSGLLFTLLLLDQAEGWQVIVLAVVSGSSTGFFHPARRAMLPNMVEQSHLRSAMALSQTGQTSMRIGGALMAGLLLMFADFTWIFGVMTVLTPRPPSWSCSSAQRKNLTSPSQVRLVRYCVKLPPERDGPSSPAGHWPSSASLPSCSSSCSPTRA